MFKDVFFRDPREKKEEEKPQEEVPEEVQETVEEVEEEDYDPFAHRKVPKPTSDFGALAHIIKTSFGSGILAMPMAFKFSGLVIGAVGTVLLGILATHCVEMLVKNSQILCKKYRVPILSFPDTAEKAFLSGPKKFRRMSKFVGIVITAELLGSFILGNSVYVVFISHTIFQIAEFYWKPGVDIRVYSALLWVPLMLMCMLPNLKSLVPFSIVANIFVLVSFSIILYYIFRNIKPVPSVELVASLETWPLFMGTIIFAIEGIGTVLSIENEMKNPKHFVGIPFGILYGGMLLVIILYGFIGFFGYLEYGKDTKGSIALNLPTEELLAQAVKALIALAIFFTYALQFYVPINLIVGMITAKINDKYHFYTKIGVRVGLVTITTLGVAEPTYEFANQKGRRFFVSWGQKAGFWGASPFWLLPNSALFRGMETTEKDRRQKEAVCRPIIKKKPKKKPQQIIISVAIPHLEPIISLVGAVCFSMLGLLFPAMIDTMARYPNYGRCKWQIWKNISIQLLAVLILVTGVHSSIIDIIASYKEGAEDRF